jgi:DNA invertase Pin-like site-specific DNA recombinase
LECGRHYGQTAICVSHIILNGQSTRRILNESSKIVNKAELYYEIKVKPKKEAELKQKIKEMLTEGMTKVKIASELGISKDTLNKYV